MKIAIFGATGRTGKLILDQALALGWEVRALARTPGKILPAVGLQVFIGSADQPAAILQTLRGADAVVSAMGYGENTLTTFSGNVVDAMRAAGISRIVSLIGASVALPGDPQTAGMALLRRTTAIFARHAVTDGHGHALGIMASGLDYTLVRPPRLTNQPATGRIRHGLSLRLSPVSSISRADLAGFMVNAVVNGQYLQAAPMVAGTA